MSAMTGETHQYKHASSIFKSSGSVVMSSPTILVSIGSLIVACIVFYLTRRSPPYPPGPPSWPIFGVALNHPKTEFWKTYADWGRKYGNRQLFWIKSTLLLKTFILGAEGLLSFHILGRRLIILNSAADAFNLLSKRSSIYSDRPFAPMSGLMRREKSIFCM